MIDKMVIVYGAVAKVVTAPVWKTGYEGSTPSLPTIGKLGGVFWYQRVFLICGRVWGWHYFRVRLLRILWVKERFYVTPSLPTINENITFGWYFCLYRIVRRRMPQTRLASRRGRRKRQQALAGDRLPIFLWVKESFSFIPFQQNYLPITTTESKCEFCIVGGKGELL